MKLNWIEIDNFLPFAPVKQRYNFPESGLIGILGKKDVDNDSNGSGKSSFAEAIVYALTGKTVKGYKVSELVNRQHKETPFSVAISIEKSGKIYEITRGPTTLKLKEDKDNQTKQTKDLTQKYINENIISINFDTLTNSTICSADQEIPLLKLTNALKKSVVENLILGNEIDKIYTNAKKIRINIKADLDRIQEQFVKIETTVKTKIDTLKAYKEETSNKQRLLKKQIEELETKDVDRLILVNDYKEDKEVLNEYDKAKKKEIDELKEKVFKLEKIDFELERLTIREAEEYLKKEKEMEIAERDFNAIKKEANTLKEEGKKNTETLEEKNKEKVEIDKSLCFTCGQEIDQEKTTELLLKLDQEVLDVEKSNENITGKIDEIKPKYIETGKVYEAIKKEIGKYKKQSSSYDSIEEVVKLESDLANTHKSIDEKTPDVLNMKDLREKLSKVLENSNITDEELTKLYNKEEINKISEELKTKRIEYNSASLDSEYVDREKKEIDILMTKYKSKKKELTDKSEDNKYYDFIVNSFANGKDSFKNYYFETIIPYINDRVTEYIKHFFTRDDISFSFDRDLNETIVFGEKEVKYKTLSGGEKARLDFAIILTFNNLARFKMADPINFLFLDEILDGAVDSNGMEKFISKVKELGEDMLVYVTSHKSAVKEMFNDVVFFEKIKDDTYLRN